MRAPSLSQYAFALLGLLAAASASGAPPPTDAPVQFAVQADVIDVQVVNVDALVTDSSGRPVTGLRKGDFQLFEDGKPIDITYFEEIGQPPVKTSGAKPAALSAPGSVDASNPAPLRLVIYFDQQNLRTANRRHAVAQVRSFLSANLGPTDEVMVATHDLTLHVGQEFTSDRNALDLALVRLETAPSYGDGSDRDRITALNAILTAQSLASEHRKQGTLEIPCTSEVAAPAERYAEATRADVERTARALTVLVDSLAGIPGRKGLLYVSDGIPLTPGEELFQVLFEICGGDPSNGFNEAVSAEMLGPEAYLGQRAVLDAQRYQTGPLWNRVTRHANANRVSLYSLQVSDPAATMRGAEASQHAEAYLRLPRIASALTANFQNTLSVMATETGGRMILNGTEIAQDLSRLQADFQRFYSLGYSPQSRAGRAEHRIEVKVRRPDLRVAYQRGFVERSPVERVADRTLSSLFWNPAQNPLSATLTVGEQRANTDGSYSVPLRLKIPLFRLALLNQEGQFSADLRLIVASRDAAGSLDPLKQVAVPIRILNREAMTALGQYYVYNLTLRLRSGERKVAISVRDEASGTVSYLTQSISVGGAAIEASSALTKAHR